MPASRLPHDFWSQLRKSLLRILKVKKVLKYFSQKKVVFKMKASSRKIYSVTIKCYLFFLLSIFSNFILL